ncbi:MAG: MATE family efflux transporter [Woeseia sp.]|nr:MATE family efflux transporter [Woeseia sp.]|tara:strand:- start:34 stop:1401 length:1368 start_codon:yes stop_codon:yes gene_type:complete
MELPKARLTEGPVGRHLVAMTVPMLFGISTMMLQSFIDMWFIGRVGDDSLAALSFAFPVIMVVTSLAIGLGAGTSSVVARAIGANDHSRAQRLATDSLFLSFCITVGISLIGFFTTGSLFRLLGAPEDMIPLIREYMNILYFAVPFLVVSMVGMTSMRATGDTRLPSMLMIIGSILNLILDPILIFGIGPIPAMGLEGAAWAGLLSRGGIFFAVMYYLKVRSDLLTFNKPGGKELITSWRDVLHVGIPAAGTNAIIPIATGVVTAMLARYGPEAVAGFGVASRIESVVLVMFYALSAVIGPFVGQNISAGKADRIYQALRLCALFCMASGLIIMVLLALAGDWLPSLFSDNAMVTDVTKMFLFVVPVSYGTYGMVMIMNAAFNGMGKPMPAVAISVGRMVVIYLPLAFLLENVFGIAGIFGAYMVANIITGIISYRWAKASLKAQHLTATEIKAL